jgi:hypothetical protein
MTLAEVVLAALILIGAATTSLQIWAFSMAGINRSQQRQLAMNRIDAELISLQRHWHKQQDSEPLAHSCQMASEMLLDELQQEPLAQGIQRKLTLIPEEEAIMVNLSDQDEPLVRREQLVKPAAWHLCEEVE